MKNKKSAILILFILFQTPVYPKVYDFSDITLDNNFKEFYENVNKDVQLEKEIVSFLKEKQIPISLDECISIALRNNFDIKTRYETYKSSEYIYKYALSKFLPDFGYSFYSIYYRGQVLVGTALVDRFVELALSSMIIANHRLTDGGREIFEAKEKKFLKYKQREELGFSEQEVILKAASSYWRLLQAKINIEIHIKNLYERMAQLKLTENLEAAGMGTKFDVIRQQNEVASAKRSLVEAMNDFRLEQAKLSNIMGIEIETALYPVEEEVETLNLVDKNLTIEELFKTAEANRKDIKAIKNQIQAMKNERRAIYTDFVPKPRAFFQHQNQGTAKVGLGEANVVGLYVDWNLGEGIGVGTAAKIKAKSHEINSVIYELTNRLRGIKEKILDSYYNSKLLLKRVDITREQVEFAAKSVELAEMRLDSGQGILIDVIQAQSQKTIARIEYLQAVIDYNINQVEILFDEGIISADLIIQSYNP